MSTPTRVFVARLAGLPVFDPLGDQVGRVRDVVALMRGEGRRPRAIGLIVEVPGRRRVFLAMTRVTSVVTCQVITTGLVNMRRFEQRATETLLISEVLERSVRLADGSGGATVEDLALEQQRNRDWEITKVFVRRATSRGLSGGLRRRGETLLVDVDEVSGLSGETPEQGATLLMASFADMKPADIADLLHDLPDKRRLELARELDDDRLADVLEELPDDDQVQILSGLGRDRAADVLEVMQPDDAADLLAELPLDQQEQLLGLMEPDEAADVRRLMAYDENTAGGLMTTEPVILPPEASVAEALAHVRRADLSPTLAAAVYVCRPPLETPTGRFLGIVHIQRMLREPPHTPVGTVVDADLEPLGTDAPLGQVTRLLATYNLVSVPVTDEDGRLLGVITADDVLDHLLPEDWREQDDLLVDTGSHPLVAPGVFGPAGGTGQGGTGQSGTGPGGTGRSGAGRGAAGGGDGA